MNIDKQQARLAFARAARDYDAAAVLQRDLAELDLQILEEKLADRAEQ